MGNENSQLKGLEINRKSIEITDFWSLYDGQVLNNQQRLLSIFQGQVGTEQFLNQNPLERKIKNLKIYRHPNILRYIASWNKNSLKMLATERCKPLSNVLNTLGEIQLCLGLRNILCGLIFLVEQAEVRHLNICISSIYVTDDNTWKLAGFEHLWKKEDFSISLLDKSRSHRYINSIDPNEVKNNGKNIEVYSFAVFCEEVLHNKTEKHIPSVDEFKTYCATHMKHNDPEMRPKLSAILLHPFFNHDFITIHSFLSELPLKNPQTKQEFFTGLIDRLRNFDEKIVGSQLSTLLLSRIVLLDTTAQLLVTPFVLKPKTDDIVPGLLSPKNFVSFIIPKLKQVFCVHDAQIRLILLEYFSQYVDYFTEEDLKEHILPQLLLGIKDTNDVLVAKTLLCLADLVPILGSAIVIGGKRTKLFSDGRPQGVPENSCQWIEARSITPVINSVDFLSSSPDHIDFSASYTSLNQNNFNFMPERLSPEGEDILQHTNSDVDIEVDEWSDWENELTTEQQITQSTDNNNLNRILLETSEAIATNQTNFYTNNDNELEDKFLSKLTITDTQSSNDSVTALKSKSSDLTSSCSSNKRHSNEFFEENIETLDIKTQTFKVLEQKQDEEVDFFKDMEPIIKKANILLIDKDIKKDDSDNDRSNINARDNFLVENEPNPIVKIDSSRFELKVMDEDENGWNDECNDW
uniref:Putative transferase transferring phosphorus-containing groups n=1 Tax=Corethrella appendiculata TaxID=1370023 RepID=U5EYE9_9DIPT